MNKTELPVQIRWLIRRDMANVLKVERSSFEFAWDEEEFLSYLRQRNCIGMVAEDDKRRIAGFMVYSLHKEVLHLLNFAVAPWARRQGVGSQMVRRLVDKLSQQRRKQVILTIRETNLSGQLFFRRMRFQAIKVLREWIEETGEDAFVMRFDVNEQGIPRWRGMNRISQYEKV